MYQLIIQPSAQKALDRLDDGLCGRILDKIKELKTNPRPLGVVKLAGVENLWRIRIGNYRVIYEIHDDRLIVLVLRVAHRKDAYQGM